MFKKLKERIKKSEDTLQNVSNEVVDMKSQVNSIRDDLDHILNGVLNKAQLYDIMLSQLENVVVKVDRAHIVFNQESATYGVKISYSIPDVELVYDKDKGFDVNERFKAMNMLNLISAEDMQYISNQVDLANQKNQ